jgi:hypothetical protein
MSSPIFFVLLTCAAGQQPEPPIADGDFHIEARPAFAFRASLVERWTSPHAGRGVLSVYAPLPPEIPGQEQGAGRLGVVGSAASRPEVVAERSLGRRFLALRLRSDEVSLKSGVELRVEYTGTLYARKLSAGRPTHTAPPLSDRERHQYLAQSATMDHGQADFQRWLTTARLKREPGEGALQFGRRVFSYLVDHGTYTTTVSGYEARRPSRVVGAMSSDCGGLALLFVATMRANGIPARSLFGRWALPQTDAYGQFHVMAELFVDQIGWVPVDIAGTIVHHPKDRYAYFGNTDGTFITLHVDTDVEPVKGFHHGWAQYLLLRWYGTGDFWKDHDTESHWDVVRSNPG